MLPVFFLTRCLSGCDISRAFFLKKSPVPKGALKMTMTAVKEKLQIQSETGTE